MQLPGRLSSTTLGDVLGALHRTRADGLLELTEGARVHHVVLVAGLVADVLTPLPVPKLGEILRREGFLDEVALRRYRIAALEQPRRRAGELLVSEGMIAPEVVRAALRYQLRARLDALFALPDASVRFHVWRKGGGAVDVPLSPREFLHGRPRRRDTKKQERARTAQERTAQERASYEPSQTPPPASARATAPPPGTRRWALARLGLAAEVERTEVVRAFRRLAARHHPDRFPQATEAERVKLVARFAELTSAYHLLLT